MLTGAGSGSSRWRDLAVTRWREDPTRDDTGSYFFLRDIESGAVWSAGYQPSGVEPDSYEVNFTEDRAEFIRSDAELTTILEVVVSPEDDAEVRRISLVNTSDRVRDLEVTSYCELVLAPPAARPGAEARARARTCPWGWWAPSCRKRRARRPDRAGPTTRSPRRGGATYRRPASRGLTRTARSHTHSSATVPPPSPSPLSSPSWR